MKFFVLALIAFSSFTKINSCNKNSKDCKGLEKEGCMCTQQYLPVCGCDGKTYSNACHANCAGVKSWKEGECPTKQ